MVIEFITCINISVVGHTSSTHNDVPKKWAPFRIHLVFLCAYLLHAACVIWAIYVLIGQTEDTCDMLRSILAQFEYSYQVCLWDSKGVPFRVHMYVPEIHPITGKEFHEREDFDLKVTVVLNNSDLLNMY